MAPLLKYEILRTLFIIYILREMNQKLKTLRTIGEGSYGTVDLVEDQGGKLFALKRVQLNAFIRDEALEEVQALKLLRHPNLIQIYDFLEKEDSLEILMQYCQGSTLKSYCKKNRERLTAEKIINLVDQMVDAAAQMNQKGVVHRDLKPENILVSLSSENPIIKICDFGSAKRSSIADRSISFQSSFEKGTAIYTSPQQLNNSRYSAKCDVWSMGCFLYQLKFGLYPFNCSSIQALKQDIKKKTDTIEIQLPKGTNPIIKSLLKICLQYHQKQRASWKQIKLLRFFQQNYINSAVFLEYLNEIAHVGQWMFQEVWEGRKQIQFNKQIKKSFLFFFSGFLYSIFKMIQQILEQNEQFEYFKMDADVISKQSKLLSSTKAKVAQYSNIYQKIKGHISNSQHLKTFLKKIPAKRNAIYANLQHTKKYCKKIIAEILTNKNADEIISYSKVVMVMAKWSNFEKWFSRTNYIKLSNIKKKDTYALENTVEWIKKEVSF